MRVIFVDVEQQHIMSDYEMAVRLVVFEYLIPRQRESRIRALCSVIGAVDVSKESHVMGAMEHLLHLGDALLASRGYPTSFIHPFSRVRVRRCPRYNVHALLLAECDDFEFNDRRADPRAGIRIFSRSR